MNHHKLPNVQSAVTLAALLAVDEDEVLIRAGHRRPYDRDMHPKRRELLEAARHLPLSEAEIAIEFLNWRRERAHLVPLGRTDRRAASSNTDTPDDPNGA